MIRPIKDMTGERHGEWLVLRPAPGHIPGRPIKWVCRCSCGVEDTVIGDNLRRSASIRCKKCAGKMRAPWLKKHLPGKTHGRSDDPVYLIWKLMRRRCFNPKDVGYKDYGGRGITMCARWANSFEHFITDMGERPPGMTIERVDNNGPYTKKNCKWIPGAAQRSNTRHVHRITYKNVTRPAWHWAQDLGMTNTGFMYRLRKWGMSRAVTTPVNQRCQEAGRAGILKRGRSCLIESARARWKRFPKTPFNPEKFRP